MNKLSSEKTRLRYDYYDLHYCRPTQIKNNAETLLDTLGEVLRGDHIQNSMYTVSMSSIPVLLPHGWKEGKKRQRASFDVILPLVMGPHKFFVCCSSI